MLRLCWTKPLRYLMDLTLTSNYYFEVFNHRSLLWYVFFIRFWRFEEIMICGKSTYRVFWCPCWNPLSFSSEIVGCLRSISQSHRHIIAITTPLHSRSLIRFFLAKSHETKYSLKFHWQHFVYLLEKRGKLYLRKNLQWCFQREVQRVWKMSPWQSNLHMSYHFGPRKTLWLAQNLTYEMRSNFKIKMLTGLSGMSVFIRTCASPIVPNFHNGSVSFFLYKIWTER